MTEARKIAGGSLHLFHPAAGAVRILGYEDYRRRFMPLAWQDIEKRLEDGEFLSPSPNHWARQQAGIYAQEALLRPHRAAAHAIGFFAQRIGEAVEPVQFQEAAE